MTTLRLATAAYPPIEWLSGRRLGKPLTALLRPTA